MKFDKELALILIGEFSATAMLMFMIPMSCVHTPAFYNNNLQVSLGCGLAVFATLQIFIGSSGAHINPYVSIAYWIVGRMSFPLMVLYWLCQFLGGALGYALFIAVLPWDVVEQSPSLTKVHSSMSVWNAFGMEYIMTSTLIIFCCSIWDPRNSQHTDGNTLKFGCMITILNLIGERETGASLNTVHTLIPSVFHSQYTNIWVYLVSQSLAAVTMGLVWRFLFSYQKEPEQQADKGLK